MGAPAQLAPKLAWWGQDCRKQEKMSGTISHQGHADWNNETSVGTCRDGGHTSAGEDALKPTVHPWPVGTQNSMASMENSVSVF